MQTMVGLPLFELEYQLTFVFQRQKHDTVDTVSVEQDVWLDDQLSQLRHTVCGSKGCGAGGHSPALG